MDEGGGDYSVVDLWVDGKRLVDMVREYETPLARAELYEDCDGDIEEDDILYLAGKHQGLPMEEFLPPARHFFGEAISPQYYLFGVYKYADKLPLLDCTSGILGSWPLLARITTDNEKVIWSDFEQFYRSPENKNEHLRWNYDGFGSFVFERKQYETAFLNPQL
ncbi:MAG: hypothetical protein H7Y37_00840 [Anaerolineae bacterium]|nr:hypothetical protein [Gloeobacterales cyanobacterium ES-bin-313]